MIYISPLYAYVAEAVTFKWRCFFVNHVFSAQIYPNS